MITRWFPKSTIFQKEAIQGRWKPPNNKRDRPPWQTSSKPYKNQSPNTKATEVHCWYKRRLRKKKNTSTDFQTTIGRLQWSTSTSLESRYLTSQWPSLTTKNRSRWELCYLRSTLTTSKITLCLKIRGCWRINSSQSSTAKLWIMRTVINSWEATTQLSTSGGSRNVKSYLVIWVFPVIYWIKSGKFCLNS